MTRFASWTLLVCSMLAGATALGCAGERRLTRDSGASPDASAGDAAVSDAGPSDANQGDASLDARPRWDALPDVGFDPDAACASAASAAEVQLLPVDIIWVVDNSSSMAPAILEVQAGLNAFASRIDASGLDFRVILLSLRGTSAPAGRFAVCVPPPLAGDGACGDGPRFLHSSVDIKSTQPLEQVLGTLGQTLGYTAGTSRGGEPWAAFLRPEATKTIVVVSDDDSRLVADQFEHFAGGSNPWNSTELPPGILEPTWASLFDGYTFDAIYGYGSETDPSVICTYPGGSSPPKPGLTYTELVTRTGGVRAQICDGAAAWGPFFEAIATTVASTARVDCEVALPPPPAGMELDPALVNVVLGGASSTTLFKVAGPTACGPEGGWYYDDELSPTLVSLCPSSCEMAQAQLQTEGSASMEIRFGCATLLI